MPLAMPVPEPAVGDPSRLRDGAAFASRYGMEAVGVPGRLLPLRPLTISDVLDTVFVTLRRAGAPVLVILLAVLLPELLLREVVTARLLPTAPGAELDLAVAGLGWAFVSTLVGLYLGLVISAAIVALFSARDRAWPLGIRQALLLGVRRSGATVGASVLAALVVGVVFVPAVFVGTLFALTVPVAGVLVTIPVVLFVPLVGYLVSFVLVAVAVEEGTGPIATLGRTVRLLRRSFWRSVLLTLQLLVLVLVVAAAIAVLGALVAAVLGELSWILQVLGGGLFSALTTPIFAAAGLVLYRDLRVRVEGYDLEVRARERAAVGASG